MVQEFSVAGTDPRGLGVDLEAIVHRMDGLSREIYDVLVGSPLMPALRCDAGSASSALADAVRAMGEATAISASSGFGPGDRALQRMAGILVGCSERLEGAMTGLLAPESRTPRLREALGEAADLTRLLARAHREAVARAFDLDEPVRVLAARQRYDALLRAGESCARAAESMTSLATRIS
jgi:hypothetical protein